VPGVAGLLTRDGLEALRVRSDVRLVGVDPVGHGMLNQSVPLTRADLAHDLGFTGGGVTVAVLDSGIDTDHANLSDDLVGENCFCANGGGCCPDGNTTMTGPGSSEDDQGHGTWVSGQITSNGTSGGVGMAPDAAIVAIKVLDSNNSGLCSDAVLALEDVRDNWNQVDIVNMSLGFSPLTNSPCDGAANACITSLESVLQDLQDEEVTVFASSGNDGSSTQMRPPACISTVVSVGAVYDANVGSNSFGNPVQCTDNVTAADVVTCYSNTDTQTDLLAPGTCISSSSLGGGVGGCGQGTSASSPHAAGCAAIVVERLPGITPATLRSTLTSTGVSVLDPRNNLTFPRIDCTAALCQACAPIDLEAQIPAPLTVECNETGGTPSDDAEIETWAEQATATSDCGLVDDIDWKPEDDFFEMVCGGGPGHTVSFTATHTCGDQVEEDGLVMVDDTTDPVIDSPPPITVECSETGGTPATDPEIAGWLAMFSATDVCDADVDLDLDFPKLFPSGCAPGETTVVTAAATDDCSNLDEDLSSVTVQDTEPPTISGGIPDPACLWPPNHEYVCFDDVLASATITDVCDADPVVEVTCSSDQCDDAPCPEHPGQNGDGNTTDDCTYDAAADRVCMRAERAGNVKAGRTYTVSVAAQDNCGNAADAATLLTVHVPHNGPAPGCISP
jgi:hypothetical protein